MNKTCAISAMVAVIALLVGMGYFFEGQAAYSTSSTSTYTNTTNPLYFWSADNTTAFPKPIFTAPEVYASCPACLNYKRLELSAANNLGLSFSYYSPQTTKGTFHLVGFTNEGVANPINLNYSSPYEIKTILLQMNGSKNNETNITIPLYAGANAINLSINNQAATPEIEALWVTIP